MKPLLLALHEVLEAATAIALLVLVAPSSVGEGVVVKWIGVKIAHDISLDWGMIYGGRPVKLVER
jgi:hypothetical protein